MKKAIDSLKCVALRETTIRSFIEHLYDETTGAVFFNGGAGEWLRTIDGVQ